MSNQPNNRGRPRDPEREAKARKALLKAATHLLKSKSYSEISIRELATKARLNSAMISYYFGSKEDLFFEVIKHNMSSIAFQRLEELDADQSLEALHKLRELVRIFIGLHHDHPWVSRLIIDQVILTKGKLRRLFVQKISSKMEVFVLRLIEDLVRQGYFRADLNIEYARMSLVSLLVFPFVAAPMLKDAMSFDLYRMDVDPWTEHTLTLFISGCKA